MSPVVFVSDARDIWGAEQSLLTLAKGLIALGLPVILCTHSSTLATQWVRLGGRVETVSHSPKTLVRLWHFARALRRIQRATPTEAVVLFSLTLTPLVAVSFLLGGAMVLDLHDYLPTRSGRLKVRVVSRFCRSVVAVSAFAAGQASPRVTTTVLTRPVDASPGPAGSRGPDVQVVGVVGRVESDKAIEVGIEAVARLGPRALLEVRGAVPDGASRTYLDSVMELGRATLRDRVRFVGRVPRERAMDGLAVLLVCNAREAMGRTVLEAQLAGVPVVVPDQGGAAELVRDQDTGFHYRAGDPAAAAQALERALGDDFPDVARRAQAEVRRAQLDGGYASRYHAAVRRPDAPSPRVRA